MSCFPCFQNNEEEEVDKEQLEQLPVAQPRELDPSSPEAGGAAKEETSAAKPADESAAATAEASAADNKDEANAAGGGGESGNSNARTFNFRELATATKNFKQESLIGESGFGKVFKGTLPDGQLVAVKRLDRTGGHDSKEFSVEVLVLTLLHHPNLLNLIGYCADGEQRLLVYEYTPNGCLQDHLFDLPEDKEPIDWFTRMKIASGVAQGLEYLHEKANPPIIYRDLKPSSILLDEGFSPKLSDYGLAKLEGGGNNSLLAPRSDYFAPEYEQTGELTMKSDVYSFGVVLLELLSGRPAMDPDRPIEEQNLVQWAQPIFKDPKRFPEIADPLLKKAFPMRSLNQAVGVAAMCLQEESSVRPLFGDVVAALSFLAVATNEPLASSLPDPEPQKSEKPREDSSSSSDSDSENDDGERSDVEDGSEKDDGERSDVEDGNGSDSSEHSGDEGEEEKQTEPLRNNDAANDSSDEDSDKLSFCYSVHMRSNSISESNDGGSPKSNVRQESSLKPDNNDRSFGSYSASSDDEDTS